MVGHLPYPDVGFLEHLARDRLFQALARFDESGQRRVHARRKARLAPQQATVAVMHQHDHGRIGAREMRRGAVRIGAAPDMTGFGADGRMAADAAEPVAGVPPCQATRIGQYVAFIVPQQRPETPQIGEAAPARQTRMGGRVFQIGKIDREIGGFAHEGRAGRTPPLPADRRRRAIRPVVRPDSPSMKFWARQIGTITRFGRRPLGVDPALVLAQRRYPIEHAAGIKITFAWHDIIGGTGRRF